MEISPTHRDVVAIQRGLNPGRSFTREEKLRAKTLYLVKRWSSGEIAEELGKFPAQITNLANKQGWAKQRREMEEKAAAAAERSAMEDAQEFVDSVAIRSEELAEKGFNLADSAANEGDAKAFAMAASGTKTFVGLHRQAKGMDATTAIAGTVNLFFGAPSGPAGMKQAEKTAPEALEAPNSETDLEFA